MCLSPVPIYHNGKFNPDTGKPSYDFRPNKFANSEDATMYVPCGKCVECLEARRLEWCKRMKLELMSSGCASFVTLTFRDPAPDFVRKSDVQKFFKRLRHLERDTGIPFPRVFKYFVVGEYGSKFGRPHYHAILFGIDFRRAEFRPHLACFSGGYPVYTTPVLERYWPYGFVSVDEVNSRSIRYVSKYVSKSAHPSKWSLPGHEEFYLTSRGLGRDLFFDVSRDGRKQVLRPKPLLRTVYGVVDDVHDFIVLDPKSGKRERPPRFLDRYLGIVDAKMLEAVKAKRIEFLRNRAPELAPPSVREQARIRVLAEEAKRRKLDSES